MKRDLNDLKQKSSLDEIHFSEDKKRETFQKLEELEQKQPKGTFFFKKTLSFATLSILLIIVAAIGFQSLQQQTGQQEKPQEEQEPSQEQPSEDEKEQDDQDTEQQPETFSEEKAEALLKQFYEDVYPELDENNTVTRYDSVEDAITQVKKSATEEVAQKWVNSFMEEKDGELKPKTFHGIKRFDFSDIRLEENGEGKFKIEQLRSNELNGTYVIQTEFEWMDGKWLITKYDIEYKEEG
ncbi:hypothetical protein ACSVDE_07160 [Pseudalkalibacillus sp. Hm43]|uniref:hypothetical protein n=1 Tax=Pseudalkalibacillus sp. Hm43 TaxID=3450742 RepID=UPI003F41C487